MIWRRSYNVIPHRPHRTDRETAAGKAQRYHTDLKLIYMLPIMPYATRRVDIQSRRPLQISPEQPTPSLQNCHAHSLKIAKTLSQLATYLAFFSGTYLATSPKLAKFSVTVLNARRYSDKRMQHISSHFFTVWYRHQSKFFFSHI